MTGHKRVGHALTGLGEAGKAPELPQSAKPVLPPGEQLMHVGLVAHVKNQAVPGGIIDSLQSHRQLHNAQIPC